MEIVKIPRMEKQDYDRLIRDNYMSRIAFRGEEFPYMAPFLYVFDGRYLYFLPTKYGKKIELYKNDPSVIVEIEQYAPDLSSYHFVTLQGELAEVTGEDAKRAIKERFVARIKEKRISKKFLAALGHSPAEPVEALLHGDRTLVWKLTNVREIVALKNP
ncbi:MAG: pyridoxamine 5'-phosphate oxidase family protein [Methanomicrobiales archaeon]|nr:pyridoxamine 5'-phosphate oxidase family protein [Methanomicrobiales archaeon]